MISTMKRFDDINSLLLSDLIWIWLIWIMIKITQFIFDTSVFFFFILFIFCYYHTKLFPMKIFYSFPLLSISKKLLYFFYVASTSQFIFVYLYVSPLQCLFIFIFHTYTVHVCWFQIILVYKFTKWACLFV